MYLTDVQKGASSMKGIRRAMGWMLCVSILLWMGTALAGDGAQAARFSLSVVWVNPASTTGLDYSYRFTEERSGTVHEMLVPASNLVADPADPRILRGSVQISLPPQHVDGKATRYGLAQVDGGSLRVGGSSYVLSTAESEDPASGASYYHRSHVLTRQLAPMLAVRFDGVEPQPFRLRLGMQSWAKDQQHQASADVQEVPPEGVDLLKLFGTADDAPLFRHFALAELSWDGKTIAGENQFSLQVDEISGVRCEISGTASDGFQLRFYPAP